MKKIVFLLLAVVLVMSTSAIQAAKINYNRSTMYTDGASVDPAKIPTIQYQGWYGPTQANPENAGPIVTDNVQIVAPDPPAGATWWYTVTAILDGATSAKAAAKSKTVPFKTPAVDQPADQVRDVE